MRVYSLKHNLHPTAWPLAATISILAITIILIVAVYPTEQGPQIHQPDNAQLIPALRTDPLQPECQPLPECGYIQMHANEQNLTGSSPVGQANAPVLTPACDD